MIMLPTIDVMREAGSELDTGAEICRRLEVVLGLGSPMTNCALFREA